MVIRVGRLRPAGQPCPGPLGEQGHQPLAPGVEADHPARHAPVGVLLPVHRGGGVAGEVGTGELAECLVQEAVLLAGRGRDVLAGQVRAESPPQVGVTAQPPRLRLGVEQADTRMAGIELAAGLEGGGSVVFLEFAAPVDHAVAGQVAEQWRTAAGDAEFGEVRRAAQIIDAGYRKSTPWWGRCDLNEAHIRRAADGRLVLIDVFCMDGASLYRKILEDTAGVHRRIPRERMRYALDIPYIARENSTAEILALRKAWARTAG